MGLAGGGLAELGAFDVGFYLFTSFGLMGGVFKGVYIPIATKMAGSSPVLAATEIQQNPAKIYRNPSKFTEIPPKFTEIPPKIQQNFHLTQATPRTRSFFGS